MIQLNLPDNSIVLIRVDYNISTLNDTYRIESSKNTIENVLSQGYKVVLITHYGRPLQNETEFSTLNLVPTIKNILNEELEYVNQYDSFTEAKTIISNSDKRLFILENTRFNKDENCDDTALRNELGKKYAVLGNYFIDEAISVSHRQEVTNTEITKYLPHNKGIRYDLEIENLNKLKSPEKPFYIYMGGAKVETKLPIIKKLISKADKIFLGGMICFTFLKVSESLGSKIPPLFDSPIDENSIIEVKELLLKYKEKLILPIDLVYKSTDGKIVAGDIGSLTTNIFCNSVKEAETIFWNGSFGQVELPTLDYGTNQFVQQLIELTDTFVVVGGGDTEALLTSKQKEKIDFVSTGGGATLDYISKL